MSKTSLAIVPAVEKAVTPKPTKAEIIEAMVKVRMVDQIEEIKIAKKKEAELEAKAKTLLEKHFKKNIKSLTPTVNLGYHSSHSGHLSGVQVSFGIHNLPEDVEKAIKDFHTFTVPTAKNESELRKEIRAKLDGIVPSSDRVQMLLNSSDARKALQETLSAIGMGPKIIPA